jgi:hypothetical protein
MPKNVLHNKISAEKIAVAIFRAKGQENRKTAN